MAKFGYRPRIHYRTKGHRRTSYSKTPATYTRTTTGHRGYWVGGGKGNLPKSYVPGTLKTTTSATPATTNIDTSYTPSRMVSIGAPNIQGTAGTVLIASSALLVFATWDTFWSGFFGNLVGYKSKTNAAGKPTQWKPQLLGWLTVGILTTVASTSDDVGGLVLLIIIAMWIVFVIFNQAALQAFFGWFGTVKPTGSVVGGGAQPPVSTYPPNQH